MSNVIPLETPRCVLWDFDGTLAHREGFWSECLADIVNRRFPERQVTAATFSPYLQAGFPWHALQRDPRSHRGSRCAVASAEPGARGSDRARGCCLCATSSAPQAADLARSVRLEYLAPNAWQVYADVVPCLTSLIEQGWMQVVLSNHVPELPDLVSALGLAQYFSAVVTSGMSGYEKPHPEAFEVVCRALSPDAVVVMVGDNDAADVRGAKDVGIPAVLVRKPNVDAKMYAASLEALPAIFEAHDFVSRQRAASMTATTHVEH